MGERGHILVSKDLGLNWNRAKVPNDTTLTGIFFLDNQLGWATGHDATILRTWDGGDSWEMAYDAPEDERPLFDIWFNDRSNGFAVGAYGLFMETSDGGHSWSQRTIGSDDVHLNRIEQSGAGHLFIAAERGTIYRSSDEGLHWTKISPKSQSSFFGILALQQDQLLAFGLRGQLFRSADGGKSWRRIATGTQAMLTDGVMLSNGIVVIVGLEGTVLVSQDAGHHFERRQLPRQPNISAVLQIDDQSFITIGANGVNRLPLDWLVSD